jgi:hypothetical protein
MRWQKFWHDVVFFCFWLGASQLWRHLYILLEASIQKRGSMRGKELILKHDVKKDFCVVDI